MSQSEKMTSNTGNNCIDEDLLEDILEAVTPVQPPLHLRGKILSSICDPQTEITTIRGNEGWQELAPGICYKLLCVDAIAHTKSFLLKAAPGVTMPGHSHHGYEECLVLEGEFSIGDIHLKAGDFHGASAGSVHPESRTTSGVLVYLKSAMEDYPEIRA